MLYLDTSLLVAALTREPHTELAQAWLEEQVPERLMVSHLVITEFSSALSLKIRTGQIDIGSRRQALAGFRSLLADSLTVVAVLPEHFMDTAKFVDQHTLALRTGDALHLAVAVDKAAAMCTFDRRLAEAATALGIEVIFPQQR
ncbi:MAG: type II toxin-antitoxin system VapC family toxin [Mesorhizobium sp.]|nr:type II toxin-antitoxin system VapC family toxin [Mesorhizobium sp.]